MSRRINKDSIDTLFEHGVDKQNRRIFLFDDIDAAPIGIVIKALYMMDSESFDKPVELYIGSFGGCEFSMFALYDAIQTIHCPIHTVAMGKCMSAAPLLVAAGHKGERYATPNTIFMVHQGWDEIGVKRFDELKTDLRLYDKIEQKWFTLMEKNTKKPKSFWEKQCQKVGDFYFDAEQAQEWGIIDHIWSEK